MDVFSKTLDTDTHDEALNLEFSGNISASPRSTSRVRSIPYTQNEDDPSSLTTSKHVDEDYLQKDRRESLSASLHSPVTNPADGMSEVTRPSTTLASSYANPAWPTDSFLCISTTTSQNGSDSQHHNMTDTRYVELATMDETNDASNHNAQPTPAKNGRRSRKFDTTFLEQGLSATSSDAISEKAFSEVHRISAECCWEANKPEMGESRKNGTVANNSYGGFRQESASLEAFNSPFVLPPSTDLSEIVFGDQEDLGNRMRAPPVEHAPSTFSSPNRDQMSQKDSEDAEWLEVRIADALIDYEFDKNDVEQVFSQLTNVRKVLIQPHDKSMALVQVSRGDGSRIIKILSDHKLQDMRGRLAVRFAPHQKHDNNEEEQFMNDSSLLDEDASAALLRLLCESTNLDYGEHSGPKMPYRDPFQFSPPAPDTLPDVALEDSNHPETPLDLSFGHLFNSQDVHHGLTSSILQDFSPPNHNLLHNVWDLDEQCPEDKRSNAIHLSEQRSSAPRLNDLNFDELHSGDRRLNGQRLNDHRRNDHRLHDHRLNDRHLNDEHFMDHCLNNQNFVDQRLNEPSLQDHRYDDPRYSHQDYNDQRFDNLQFANQRSKDPRLDIHRANNHHSNLREANSNGNMSLNKKASHYYPSARERPNSRPMNSGLRRGACTTYAAPPDRSNTDRLRLYLRQSQSAQIDYDRDNSPVLDGTGRLDPTAMQNNCAWGDNSPEMSNGPHSANSFANVGRDFQLSGGRRPYESPERLMVGGSDGRSCFDDRRISFTTPLNDASRNNYYFDSPSSSEGRMQYLLSTHPQRRDYEERGFAPNLNTMSESFNGRHNAGDLSSSSTKVRKWTARYDIQIPTDNSFQVTRRIIGTRGANMKRINQFTGAKLRLRGRGSGYLEGSSRLEADDPLHLCISCCDFAQYRSAKQMVDRLLSQIYVDYDAWSAEVYAVEPRLTIQVREVFLPNRDSGEGSGLPENNDPKEFGPHSNSGGPPKPPRRDDYNDDI